MNHSMVSYVVWISTRDTSHNERNVPNPMLYVGNVSEIRLPLSHGRVAIAKRKKGAPNTSQEPPLILGDLSRIHFKCNLNR